MHTDSPTTMKFGCARETWSARREGTVKAYVLSAWIMGMAAVAAAETRNVQFSLTPDKAHYDRNDRVHGLALSVWGENPQAALALGFVNGSTYESCGVSIGLVMNYADDWSGVQCAPVNYVSGVFAGWQVGVVNVTDIRMDGLQCGVVNYAGRVRGVQFGLVNYARWVERGVQLGLVNINRACESWFTGLPDEAAPATVLLNWSL